MADEPVDRLPTWDELGFPGPAPPRTPSKAEMREVYRAYWTTRMLALLQAQESRVVGISHFMLREPSTGQWKRLTDPDEIQAALNHPDAEAGSTYYIHTKDPDGKDIQDVLNRVIDKPKEQAMEVVVRDGDLVNKLDRAKERARKEKA